MVGSSCGRRVRTALLLALTLAGCESQFRQDPLFVRGSSDATVFGAAPVYVDRPLSQNLTDSLIFADYTELLRRSGLADILKGPGPFTVFALVDPALDKIGEVYKQRLLDPANGPGLHALMAYTIVPGRYTLRDLFGMAQRAGGQAGLRTLDGAVLTLRIDRATNRLTLVDPQGPVSQLVLADIIQSNGMLYAGNVLLAPN